jgi:SAM-dependent methyltransferase
MRNVAKCLGYLLGSFKTGISWFLKIDQQSLLALGQSFDYVLFIETLEHLKYPQRVLIEAAKIARKGVVVTLPNSGWIGWRMQMLRGYFPRQSFTHLHFFTIRDFELFLKVLDLKPLDMKTELNYHGINVSPCNKLKNLIAYQQVWFIAPLKSDYR